MRLEREGRPVGRFSGPAQLKQQRRLASTTPISTLQVVRAYTGRRQGSHSRGAMGARVSNDTSARAKTHTHIHRLLRKILERSGHIHHRHGRIRTPRKEATYSGSGPDEPLHSLIHIYVRQPVLALCAQSQPPLPRHRERHLGTAVGQVLWGPFFFWTIRGCSSTDELYLVTVTA